MHSVSSLVDQIHTRALAAASSYRRAEADLIEVLQQVEEHGVFLKRGHSSLFHYVIQELGLSENVTYSLIMIARKARTVPELKSRIQSGEITLSNARRIAPLLTPTNQEDWLEKAATLSNRRLEKEIATVRPEAATPERASYTSADRVRLELGLSEREMLRFRRVQDLLSQARRRSVSLEEALETLTAEYLRRHDPVERAKRHQVKRGFSSSDARDEKPFQNTDGHSEPDQTDSLGKLVTLPITSSSATIVASEPPDSQLEAGHQTRHGGVPQPNRRSAHPRLPIPTRILHQVNLRDHRRCMHSHPNGERCGQSRWIEIHHLVPVSVGGTNDLDNLVTLCSSHHRLLHLSPVDVLRTRKE